MSNKKVFKKLYSKYFNKEKNYSEILDAINGDNEGTSKYAKWAFVSGCLVVALICGVLLFQDSNNFAFFSRGDKNTSFSLEPEVETNYSNTNKSDENKSVVLNINQVSKAIDFSLSDADIKLVSNYYCIPYYEELSNLVIPKDFNDKEYINAIFTKSNRDSKEYDYLMQYEKIYKTNDNQRNIVINFSDKNKPMRDYEFSDGTPSTINGFDMVIYKYENLYMTEFKYKNLYIDIETSNITEKELVALLQSIIK